MVVAEVAHMSGKQRLELTWIGKDVRPKLEPRILLEDASRSYHAKQRVILPITPVAHSNISTTGLSIQFG